MNLYEELTKKSTEEIEGILFVYTNQEEYNIIMKMWGLDPEKDKDKVICRGKSICLKENEEFVVDHFQRFKEEIKEGFKNDKTGTGFIYDTFVSLLMSGGADLVLSEITRIGYSANAIITDHKLLKAYISALATLLDTCDSKQEEGIELFYQLGAGILKMDNKEIQPNYFFCKPSKCDEHSNCENEQ